LILAGRENSSVPDEATTGDRAIPLFPVISARAVNHESPLFGVVFLFPGILFGGEGHVRV
jgi:hypothetical protein